MTELIRTLQESGIALCTDHPLAQHSTLRIGGNAALAVFPHSREQLLQALSAVASGGGAYAVVGNGSNLLFPDGIYYGTVIFTAKYREITCCGRELSASAGIALPTLAKCARDAALTGMEFASGIPGTVGGAVLMNAGAYGGEMAKITVWSEYWNADTGSCGRLEGDAHLFGKRTSFYATHPQYTVLAAGFRLQNGSPDEIAARTADFHARRRSTQPLEYPNAGSIFKHPVGHFAGKLIEDCGLKGTRIGGAEVSQKHAGFIINRGNATAEDVKRLISLIQERVMRTHGISLECELRFL